MLITLFIRWNKFVQLNTFVMIRWNGLFLMRNSVVTFARTVVPKELKMFRKSASVRTRFAESGRNWIFSSLYHFTCIIGKSFWWKLSSVVISILKDNLCLLKLGLMDLMQVWPGLSVFAVDVQTKYNWRRKKTLYWVYP